MKKIVQSEQLKANNAKFKTSQKNKIKTEDTDLNYPGPCGSISLYYSPEAKFIQSIKSQKSKRKQSYFSKDSIASKGPKLLRSLPTLNKKEEVVEDVPEAEVTEDFLEEIETGSLCSMNNSSPTSYSGNMMSSSLTLQNKFCTLVASRIEENGHISYNSKDGFIITPGVNKGKKRSSKDSLGKWRLGRKRGKGKKLSRKELRGILKNTAEGLPDPGKNEDVKFRLEKRTVSFNAKVVVKKIYNDNGKKKKRENHEFLKNARIR